jgi:hypothetical protein
LKYATYIGIAASLLLITCCFFPLAYYPDLKENFTGFYSRQNIYGKPGITCIVLSFVAIVLFLIPKLGAKRANQFVAVLIFAYSMKTYILFSSDYFSFHPLVKPGLTGMLVFSGLILICSLLSRGEIKSKS